MDVAAQEEISSKKRSTILNLCDFALKANPIST